MVECAARCIDFHPIGAAFGRVLRAGQWLGGVGVQYHHASTIRERPRAAGRSEDVRCSIATQRVAAWTREEPNQL